MGCSSEPVAVEVPPRRSDTSRAPSTAPANDGTETAGRAAVPSDPSASSSGGTSPPTFTPDQHAVVDAYQAAVAAYVESSHDPAGFDDGSLGAWMTGPFLATVRAELAADRADGRATRPGPERQFRTDVLTVDIRGSSAIVRTCTVDDEVVYEIATNEVLNAVTSTALHDVGLVMDGATWKVSTRSLVSKVEGAVRCELVG